MIELIAKQAKVITESAKEQAAVIDKLISSVEAQYRCLKKYNCHL